MAQKQSSNDPILEVKVFFVFYHSSIIISDKNWVSEEKSQEHFDITAGSENFRVGHYCRLHCRYQVDFRQLSSPSTNPSPPRPNPNPKPKAVLNQKVLLRLGRTLLCKPYGVGSPPHKSCLTPNLNRVSQNCYMCFFQWPIIKTNVLTKQILKNFAW